MKYLLCIGFMFSFFIGYYLPRDKAMEPNLVELDASKKTGEIDIELLKENRKLQNLLRALRADMQLKTELIAKLKQNNSLLGAKIVELKSLINESNHKQTIASEQDSSRNSSTGWASGDDYWDNPQKHQKTANLDENAWQPLSEMEDYWE